jgi:hypothetical protein
VIALALAAALSQDLPRFREQLVDDRLGDLWAAAVADVDADGKPDLLALNWNPPYVAWYRNPTWQRRMLVEGNPKELVAILPLDVDGDGKTEFILGAEYHEPPDPKKGGGGIYLLRRPDDLEQPWAASKIGEIPTLHRLQPLDGRGVVASALHGPTVVLRPAATGAWTRETIAEQLSACHNTTSVDWDGDGRQEVLTASREGVTLWKRETSWKPTLIAKGNGGASEIAVGRLPGGKRFLATIEPHHGHEFCVYVEEGAEWKRQVLLVSKGGHTLKPADLTGTKVDSLLVGFVGQYSKHPGGPIWHVYHPLDAAGQKWAGRVLDDTKLPGEDGAVADLDGDGRLDCVVAGGNRLKVYWNERR